jgi:hypothetical protein
MKGAGGGKRGGRSRKPTRVEADDRPRGYEATRMRQLWRDIDHAKRKAGLGPVPTGEAPAVWDMAAMLERAAALVGEVATWMTAQAPAACAALAASGAELLRGVPVVGRLVDLVPLPAPAEGGGPNGEGRAALPADHHGNGTVQQVTADPDSPSDLDEGWLH